MIRPINRDELNVRWERGEGGKMQIASRMRKEELLRAAKEATNVAQLREVLVHMLQNDLEGK